MAVVYRGFETRLKRTAHGDRGNVVRMARAEQDGFERPQNLCSRETRRPIHEDARCDGAMPFDTDDAGTG